MGKVLGEIRVKTGVCPNCGNEQPVASKRARCLACGTCVTVENRAWDNKAIELRDFE
jgi:ribosomal protein S27AE